MPRIRVNALSEHDGQQENDVNEYQVRNVTQGKDLSPFPAGVPDGEDLPYFVEYSDSDWSQGDEVEVRAVDTDGNVGDPISFASACIPSINSIGVPDFVQTGDTFTVGVGASVTEGSIASVEAVYEGQTITLSLSNGVYVGDLAATEAGVQDVEVVVTESSEQALTGEDATTITVGTSPVVDASFAGSAPYANQGTDGGEFTVSSGTPQDVQFDDGTVGITGAKLTLGEQETASADTWMFAVHLKRLSGDASRIIDRRQVASPPKIDISNINSIRGTLKTPGDDVVINTPADLPALQDAPQEAFIGFEYQRESTPGAGDGLMRIVLGDGIGVDGRVTNPEAVAEDNAAATVDLSTSIREFIINAENEAIARITIVT